MCYYLVLFRERKVLMTKLVVIPDDINKTEELLVDVDAILVGIVGMSVNCLDISMDELSSLMAKTDKDIYVSLNKNMHNQDLPKLESILIQCEQLGVAGVFYSDVAVLQIARRLSLDMPLVWSAEHLVTNLFTIQYWEQFNIAAAFLANELTLEEMLEIKENVSVPVIVQCFGYLPMYVSKRMAIKNYLNYFKLQTASSRFYLYKEGKKHPIVERPIGTEIYSDYILNAIAEYLVYKEKKIDYVLLSGFGIKREEFLRVIKLFKTVNKRNVKKYKEEIDMMFSNSSVGSLHTETIYQVKKHEK